MTAKAHCRNGSGTPAHFGGQNHFAEQVRQLCKFERDTPRIEGVERIMLPGDPERFTMARRLSDGIFLDDQNWQQLTGLAERLNVAAPTGQR